MNEAYYVLKYEEISHKKYYPNEINYRLVRKDSLKLIQDGFTTPEAIFKKYNKENLEILITDENLEKIRTQYNYTGGNFLHRLNPKEERIFIKAMKE